MLSVLHSVSLFIVATTISTTKYYISKNGTDYDECGPTISSSCATLYYVSNQIKKENDNYTIEVYDGQNKDVIEEYLTQGPSKTDYNYPCLPIDFYSYDPITITITFNPQFIKKMSDWYPNAICNGNPTATSYSTKYMFYCEDSIKVIINNLIVDDYDTITNPFGIISIFDDYFSCNKCMFKNINNKLNYTMFSLGTSRVILSECTFTNIYSYSNLMRIYIGGDNMTITDSQFTNITMSQSFLYLYSSVFWLSHVYFAIEDCKFININTTLSIIHKATQGLTLTLHDTKFENVLSGSIIISESNYYISTDYNV
eukprot:30563_1